MQILMARCRVTFADAELTVASARRSSLLRSEVPDVGIERECVVVITP
jgi:hypothetical protein